MKIKVLGSGCANCHKLYEETLKAVKNISNEIEVEYITDIKIMLSYGIMSAPALMINDKVVSQGRVLKASDIEKLINGLEIKKDCTCNNCNCK
jgi:small redox-active disulfide protein 2